MGSLSRSIFSSLAFALGLLLVMTSAHSINAPPTLNLEGEGAIASHSSMTENILYILSKISEMKQQICKIHAICEESEVMLLENNLKFPEITKSGGCLLTGFNQETCLNTIISGLLQYQPYLNYLEDNYSDETTIVEQIQKNIRVLIQNLRIKMVDARKITMISPSQYRRLMKELRAQSDWMMNTTFYLTLNSLTSFLQYTTRAIRLMA